ncbi:MAG: YqcC family protein [Pseudomonadota bacterium]
MADTRDALRSITESIENELKRLEIWDEEPPSAEALKSQEPFCFDTLGFAQWMQWIFLPRVQEVVENERDMPAQSDVHTYAEEVLKNTDYESEQLLFLIKTFDEIVATGGDAVTAGN